MGSGAPTTTASASEAMPCRAAAARGAAAADVGWSPRVDPRAGWGKGQQLRGKLANWFLFSAFSLQGGDEVNPFILNYEYQ